MNTQKIAAIKNIIDTLGGKIATVKFIKKDGTELQQLSVNSMPR